MATTTRQPRRPRGFARLMGLPGVKRRVVRAVVVNSVTEAMEFVRRRATIIASGGTGSITIWRDDAGQWWCEFQRYMLTLSLAVRNNRAEMRAWLKVWWPRLGRD